MIELRVLGPIDLRGEDGRAIRSILAQEKRLALLTFLAVSKPSSLCRRDRVLATFWPETSESLARNSLNQAIFQLRRSLGQDAVVSRGPGEVGIAREVVWCDVAAFEEALETGDLARAVELYRGPLLDGFAGVPDAPDWDHWLDAARERLRRGAATALRGLARSREAAGDPASALGLLERLESESPYDSEVALWRMRLLADRGDRAGALACARAFEVRMMEAFGTAADPEVASFAERLRAGSRPLPAPGEPPGAEPPVQTAAPEPVRPAEASRFRLQFAATQLVGRSAEVETVHRSLLASGVRLLTLTGPGGVGKTRLALEVARAFEAHQAYQVVCVGLATLTDPALVPSAIAEALGLREVGAGSLSAAVHEHLRERRVLVVLDNFEHLAPAAGDIADLLQSALYLRVLVTSRSPLRLSMEQEYPVAPLPVPASGPLSLDELARCPSVELFVSRARAVRPDFELSKANAGDIAEICARLDGLPLAIELAAARIRALTPASIRARLRRRFRLLTGGARDLPARQQTLHDAIGWSYELLTSAERQLFRRLAAFRGGWRLEDAEAVCLPVQGLGTDLLDAMESLLARSLISRVEERDGEVRYRMLETLREYAWERLEEDPSDLGAVVARHAALFVDLAETAEPRLLTAAKAEWLSRLQAENDNLRAALERAAEREDAETLLRLAAVLWRYWWMRGNLSEGRRWTDLALRSSAATPHLLRPRARALLAASVLALYQADLSTALSSGGMALELFRELGDREGIASAHSCLGQQAWKSGELALAREHYDRAIAIHRETEASPGLPRLLFSLGSVAIDEGRFDEARRLYAECLGLNKDVGDRELDGYILINLGMIAYRSGELLTARRNLERGLEIARSTGTKQHLAGALNTLGVVARDLEDFASAREFLRESFALHGELGDRLGLAHVAHSLGSLELRQGDDSTAAPLLRQSLALFRAVGVPPPPECLIDAAELALRSGSPLPAVQFLGAASRQLDGGALLAASDRRRFDRAVADSRARLKEDAWHDAWASGSDLEAEAGLGPALDPEAALPDSVLASVRVAIRSDQGNPSV